MGIDPISIGIMAAASIGSSLIGSSAAKKAANAQVAASDKAQDTLLEVFNKQAALQEPFRQGGLSAQNRLLDLLGLSTNTGAEGFGSLNRDFSMADFEADPGYGFRFDEGMKALNNSMAARGLGISGRNIKGAQRFGQDLASQEYQNAFNRYQVNRANKLNPLQSLMGSGQSAANTLTGAAGNYGAGVADLQTQAGNARASGYVGSANAWNSGLSGIVNNFLTARMLR